MDCKAAEDTRYYMRTMTTSTQLLQHFDDVSDPRRGEPVYPLTNILFMAICAVIAGADDFVAIAKFANTKKEWFAKYFVAGNNRRPDHRH